MESDKLCLDSTCKLETGELVRATGLFPTTNQKTYVLLWQRASVCINKKRETQRHVRDENKEIKMLHRK